MYIYGLNVVLGIMATILLKVHPSAENPQAAKSKDNQRAKTNKDKIRSENGIIEMDDSERQK